MNLLFIEKEFNLLKLKDDIISHTFEPKMRIKGMPRHTFYKDLEQEFKKEIEVFNFSPFIQEKYDQQQLNSQISKFKSKSQQNHLLNFIKQDNLHSKLRGIETKKKIFKFKSKKIKYINEEDNYYDFQDKIQTSDGNSNLNSESSFYGHELKKPIIEEFNDIVKEKRNTLILKHNKKIDYKNVKGRINSNLPESIRNRKENKSFFNKFIKNVVNIGNKSTKSNKSNRQQNRENSTTDRSNKKNNDLENGIYKDKNKRKPAVLKFTVADSIKNLKVKDHLEIYGKASLKLNYNNKSLKNDKINKNINENSENKQKLSKLVEIQINEKFTNDMIKNKAKTYINVCKSQTDLNKIMSAPTILNKDELDNEDQRITKMKKELNDIKDKLANSKSIVNLRKIGI